LFAREFSRKQQPPGALPTVSVKPQGGKWLCGAAGRRKSIIMDAFPDRISTLKAIPAKRLVRIQLY
jgi:hypothetical protein